MTNATQHRYTAILSVCISVPVLIFREELTYELGLPTSLCSEISNESGRLAITEIMTNVFRTVMATSPQDLLPIVYLAANRVAPPHEGVELGIGDAAIIKALAEAAGRKEAMVKSEYKVRATIPL